MDAKDLFKERAEVDKEKVSLIDLINQSEKDLRKLELREKSIDDKLFPMLSRNVPYDAGDGRVAYKQGIIFPEIKFVKLVPVGPDPPPVAPDAPPRPWSLSAVYSVVVTLALLSSFYGRGCDPSPIPYPPTPDPAPSPVDPAPSVRPLKTYIVFDISSVSPEVARLRRDSVGLRDRLKALSSSFEFVGTNEEQYIKDNNLSGPTAEAGGPPCLVVLDGPGRAAFAGPVPPDAEGVVAAVKKIQGIK